MVSSSYFTLDLRRGYATSFPPNQVNDSNKGSNGPAGSRSGKLHSEERDGLSVPVTGRALRFLWSLPVGLFNVPPRHGLVNRSLPHLTRSSTAAVLEFDRPGSRRTTRTPSLEGPGLDS